MYNCDTINVVDKVNIDDIRRAYQNDIANNANTYTAEDIDAVISLNTNNNQNHIPINVYDLVEEGNSEMLMSIINNAIENYDKETRKNFALDMMRTADKYPQGADNFEDEEYNEEFVDVFNSLHSSYQKGIMKNFNHVDNVKFIK